MSGPRDRNEGAELIEAYLDGVLDEEGGERLVAWLRDDPAHVRELVETARLHSDLGNAVRARVARASSAVQREVGPEQPRPSAQLAARRRRLRMVLPLALSAAAAAIALMIFLVSRPSHAAVASGLMEVVAIVPGDGASPGLDLAGGQMTTLAVGARAGDGDHLVTRSAKVTLRSLRDATVFELSAGTTLSLAGAASGRSLRVSLDAGTLHAIVAKQPPGSSLKLRTPHALVEVVGTVFTLAVEAASTRLEVSEGIVRYTSLADDAKAEVKAGGHASSWAAAAPSPSPYTRWKRGPSADPTAFPLGVWAQDPAQAARLHEAGIGCFVGLPAGAFDDQLAALRAAGMTVVCEPTEAALAHVDDTVIVGWIGAVRPDDAPDATGGGGDAEHISTIGAGAHTPTPPAEVLARHRELGARDATRPVLLILGQGAAWDDWYGRGTRSGHPGDYPQYLAGCDIAAFGIDPLGSRAIAGQLGQVGAGAERLERWSPSKPDWCLISCAPPRAGPPPTAAQLRSQVWLALIGGADGIVWSTAPPAGPPAAGPSIAEQPDLLAAIAAIDHRVAALAPALNRPSLPPVKVASAKAAVPIATALKAVGGLRYLFAAASRSGATTATFTVPDLRAGDVVEVLDEDRRVAAAAGSFADDFADYGVHLYAIRPATEEQKP